MTLKDIELKFINEFGLDDNIIEIAYSEINHHLSLNFFIDLKKELIDMPNNKLISFLVSKCNGSDIIREIKKYNSYPSGLAICYNLILCDNTYTLLPISISEEVPQKQLLKIHKMFYAFFKIIYKEWGL